MEQYRMTGGDNDFKYVLQDLSKTMLGARFTYQELLEQERVPFKFQTIIDRLILPCMQEDMEIGKHMLLLTASDKNFRIYDSLKTRIRYYMPNEKGTFEQKTVPLTEFVKAAAHWPEKAMVHEVILSNLALMAFKI